ncbi:shikimate kinase [Aerosakkonema funiforme]|uniref:Shikimate kinase n=1 Tax=Aerosakkonema funiforme FACHB-1375 TaxID=2949571 RepID=A0A926VC47_9CYAN|nr:shikimate kinase [Aerosakkonema funiforme]MBD2179849.1 shikimate kinase [Aerosakkonema funiforme FACHB-1375]
MNNILRGINLYLIGMMGAGKTTVGRLLAQQLGYRFFDTDALIEQAAGGQSINEIFATAGEEAFREIESQVLAELSAYTKLAISTGGGIVLRQKNWSYLHHGLIVWLDVPVELLMTRLAEDSTRPLLKDANPQKKLEMLLEQRRKLYAQADIRVTADASLTPEQVAARVIEEIPKVIKPEVTAADN